MTIINQTDTIGSFLGGFLVYFCNFYVTFRHLLLCHLCHRQSWSLKQGSVLRWKKHKPLLMNRDITSILKLNQSNIKCLIVVQIWNKFTRFYPGCAGEHRTQVKQNPKNWKSENRGSSRGPTYCNFYIPSDVQEQIWNGKLQI